MSHRRSSQQRFGIDHLRMYVSLVATALTLSSCALVPDEGARSQPKTPDMLASNRSFDVAPGDWPTEAWWRSFGDEQLNALMDEALARAPTLTQARARLREAESRAGLARAQQFPSIGANIGAQEEKLTYKGIFPAEVVPRGWNDSGNATLDLAWEFDFWGKNRSSFDAAVSEVRAGEAEAAATRVLLTTGLAQAYVEFQYLFMQLDIARTSVTNREASERLVSRRVAEGLEAEAALEQARARLNQSIAELAAVDERLRLSRNAIAALIGAGPDRGLSLRRTPMLARRPIGLPPTLAVDMLGRKPEIVAARWHVEAAAKRIGVARASFYPNVNLMAFLGFQSLGLNQLGSSGSDIGNVGVAIHLPIFDAGRLKANYGATNAQYELAVATYDATLSRSLQETADAARSLQSLEVRFASIKAALANGERAYQLSVKRYDGGLSSFQPVLSTEDAVLQIRKAEAELRTRGVSLDIALVKALGGGFAAASTQAQVTP